MRLYFVSLPVCTLATAVEARYASVAFDFWVRSETLCTIITRADWSLAAVYCDMDKEMNLTLGEERAVRFFWYKVVTQLRFMLDSSWNVMAHGDSRERKWRGNWRMEWVASTLNTTSERGVSSITTADAHTSAAQ